MSEGWQVRRPRFQVAIYNTQRKGKLTTLVDPTGYDDRTRGNMHSFIASSSVALKKKGEEEEEKVLAPHLRGGEFRGGELRGGRVMHGEHCCLCVMHSFGSGEGKDRKKKISFRVEKKS